MEREWKSKGHCWGGIWRGFGRFIAHLNLHSHSKYRLSPLTILAYLGKLLLWLLCVCVLRHISLYKVITQWLSFIHWIFIVSHCLNGTKWTFVPMEMHCDDGGKNNHRLILAIICSYITDLFHHQLMSNCYLSIQLLYILSI